jgi:hypothetical protein
MAKVFLHFVLSKKDQNKWLIVPAIIEVAPYLLTEL